MASIPAPTRPPSQDPPRDQTHGGEAGEAYWERFFASLSPEEQATLDGLAEIDKQYGDDFERERQDRARASETQRRR